MSRNRRNSQPEKGPKDSKEDKPVKPPKASGAVAELDVFDYSTFRADVKNFNDARRKLIDYAVINYDHAGHVLEHGVEYDWDAIEPPTPTILAGDGADAKKAKWSRYDSAIRQHDQKKETYNRNKTRLYGVLWGQCTVALRQKIQEAENYPAFSMAKDPLLLWQQIKSLVLEERLPEYSDPIKRQEDARLLFHRFRQMKTEGIAEFRERFTTEVDAAEAARVDFITRVELEEAKEAVRERYIESANANRAANLARLVWTTLTAEQRTACTTQMNSPVIVETLREKHLAMLFINKLDRTRYGHILNEWDSRLVDGYNDYPVTVSEAVRRISSRRTEIRAGAVPNQGVAFVAEEARPKEKNRGQQKPKAGEKKSQGGGKAAKRESMLCWFCGADDHLQRDCEDYKCCRESQQKKKKATAHVTWKKPGGAEDADDDADHAMSFVVVESDAVSLTGKSDDFSFFDEFDILCDNEASVSVFRQKKYLKNIRPANRPCVVNGIGGKIRAQMIGDFGDFGPVYYDPNAPASILCFSDMARRYKAEYDSEKDEFVFDTGKARVRFVNRGKVYVYNPHRAGEPVALVTTVEANKTAFTKREVAKAQEARELFVKMARPAMKDFVKHIRQGRMDNCPVTVADVERAEIIYGKELGVLQGRTIRTTPPRVNVQPRASFGEFECIVIAADVFFVDGIPFFVAVSRGIGLISTVNLPSRDKGDLMMAIRKTQSLYKAYGRMVTHVLIDGESAVKAIKDEIGDLGIQLNMASKNEHVHEAERAIRTIKERVRAFINSLPYRLTKLAKVHLVGFCVAAINMIAKGSNDLSSKEILTGVKVDFKRDCRLEYGAYCQVHEDDIVTNTMKSRVTGAIALGSTGSAQGGQKFLSLETWKVITRRSFTVVPMTKEIIRLLNERADLENDPTKLQVVSDDGDTAGVQNPQLSKESLLPRNVSRGAGEGMLIPTPSVEAADTDLAAELWPDDDEDGHVEEPSNAVIGANNFQTDEELFDSEVDRAVAEVVVGENDDDDHDSESSEDDDITVVNTELFPKDAEEKADPEESVIKAGKVKAAALVAMHIKMRSDAVVWAKQIFEAVALTAMSVNKGLKECGVEAEQSIEAEFAQLCEKKVFTPIYYDDLTSKQKVRILRTLMFLKRKRDGRLKSRFCVDGRKQAGFGFELETSSPTVFTESVMLTAVIDAKQGRHVVCTDIEGAYLHADMPTEVLIQIDPVLTAILTKIKPGWSKFVTPKGTMVMKLLKALYGCVQSARLFYEHLSKTLCGFGYHGNPYDLGVFNKDCYGHQCTITIHVDDLKISCLDRRGVDETLASLTKVYKKISTKECPIIDYLGMEFDYSEVGKVKVSMKGIIEDTLREFAVEGSAPTPATGHLFVTGEARIKLPKDRSEKFHSIVAKLLYLAKHGRPDILTAVSFLTTRVREPDEDDEKKLIRLVKYLKGSKDLVLTLEANDLEEMHAYIDASYAVHPDMKSHTGVVVTLGKGAIFCKSSKQKLVAKSSTEAELIAIADGLDNVMWMRRFMKEQGFNMKPVVIHQDNESTIKMVNNGRSTSKNTRHVSIRFFSVHDHIVKKKVKVQYTPTKEMWADYFTKPLMGSLFGYIKCFVMNSEGAYPVFPPQGCVEILRPHSEMGDEKHQDAPTLKPPMSVVSKRPIVKLL